MTRRLRRFVPLGRVLDASYLVSSVRAIVEHSFVLRLHLVPLVLRPYLVRFPTLYIFLLYQLCIF